MSGLYYNHSATRLHVVVVPLNRFVCCLHVVMCPIINKTSAVKRVRCSCSNQCASSSTSLWATPIRRRKNVVSYLFMTGFSIPHSSVLRWCSACCMCSPLCSHLARCINIERLSCYSIIINFLCWSTYLVGLIFNRQYGITVFLILKWNERKLI